MDRFDNELFLPAKRDASDAEAIRRPSIKYWADVRRRLKQNKLAMTGLIIILFMTVMAIFAPMLSGYSYFQQDYDSINQPPSFMLSKEADTETTEVTETGEPVEKNVYLFGTDTLGRDLFTRVWIGTRYSLLIGIFAALLDFVIGVFFGGVAGMASRRVDAFMMRFAEIVYSIPYMLVVILLSVTFSNQQGVSLLTMVIAMTITGWVPMAILVRGQVLQLKENDYVLASRSLGAQDMFILGKHILPNTLGPILVNVTLTIPRAIFSEATLSFMSLGLQPPTPSLGVLANDGLQGAAVNMFYQLFIPAIFISLIMFSFNVLGDGLRDALDPRLRK